MPRPEVDVVVVGGGAAGMSAADAAAQAGASVILMEAGHETGGLIALQPWQLRDRFDMFGGLTGEA
ncbi:MAG: FAD-dependent oxidoreductase, partial [Dehalococcoidia bacterium]|nr:FAD-dependent oxidoreductase [Dehalococcoidia bacterium]